MWAEMALIKKVTEKKVMFKSILSKVSHSMKFIFGAYGLSLTISLIIEEFCSHQLLPTSEVDILSVSRQDILRILIETSGC